MSTQTVDGITYLNSTDATAIDKDLMETLHYSIDQLMELAGLSVAQSVYDAYSGQVNERLLVVVGPGNNGGDGLVAARHLSLFGFQHIDILYPTLEKSTQKELYKRLVEQCKTIGLTVSADVSTMTQNKYAIMIDAVFGFSYRAADGLRSPFDTVMSQIGSAQRENKTHVVSIDVVSGYDVHDGDVNNIGVKADCLISLTAPKLFARSCTGKHYIGGRFIWPEFAKKYNIAAIPYTGSQQFVCIRR